MTDLVETRLWGDRFGCQALRSAGDAPALQLPCAAGPASPWRAVAPYHIACCHCLSNARLKLRRRILIRLAIRLPLGIALLGDLLHCALCLHRLIFEFFRNRFSVGSRFQDEPLILFIIATTNSYQRPLAFCFFPLENEVKLALAQRFKRLFTVNVISAAVPNHHGTAAVL